MFELMQNCSSLAEYFARIVFYTLSGVGILYILIVGAKNTCPIA